MISNDVTLSVPVYCMLRIRTEFAAFISTNKIRVFVNESGCSQISLGDLCEFIKSEKKGVGQVIPFHFLETSQVVTHPPTCVYKWFFSFSEIFKIKIN